MSKILVQRDKPNSLLILCRGMSDPVFFSFNVLGKNRRGGHRMLCHGVVFTSFEIDEFSESEMKVGGIEQDPRGVHFLKYVWENYLKEKRAHFEQKVKELEATIESDKASIAQIKTKIAEMKKAAYE